MVTVAPDAVLGVANPLLVLLTQVGGFLATPTAASFTIFDVSTDAAEMSPTATFGPHTVNVVADALGPGRLAAAWTVPGAEPTGRHRIVWTWTIDTPDGPVTETCSREFDVLRAVSSARGYCLVSDLRAEGVLASATGCSDVALQRVISRAAAYLERVCDRFFEPRAATYKVDGSGRTMLLMPEPVIAVEAVTTDSDDPMSLLEGGLVDLTAVKVYNRHLSGMVAPDDRDAPMLEYTTLFPGLISTAYSGWTDPSLPVATWPIGQQNVRVVGLFGYTDPDPGCTTSAGETPELIRRVSQMLVVRDLARLTDPEARAAAQSIGRLLSERTREQSYQLAPGKAGLGWATGDAELDDLLTLFVRPMRIAVAVGRR